MKYIAILLEYNHSDGDYVLQNPETNSFYLIPYNVDEDVYSLKVDEFIMDLNGPVKSVKQPTQEDGSSFADAEGNQFFIVKICGDCLHFPDFKFPKDEHWVKKEAVINRRCSEGYTFKRLVDEMYPERPKKRTYDLW